MKKLDEQKHDVIKSFRLIAQNLVEKNFPINKATIKSIHAAYESGGRRFAILSLC